MLSQEVDRLIRAFEAYRQARLSLLDALGLPHSNRDPLAEFSEVLVASLLGGRLADNRVQKDWDLETPDGKRIQVKYLANPATGDWPNWHVVRRSDQIDGYALVIFEDLAPRAVYLFPGGDLSGLCAAFGKRHAHQDCELQFTKGNHLAIMKDPNRFKTLGVEVFRMPAGGVADGG